MSEAPDPLSRADLLKLYELGVKSYETDLNLYTTRMNIFLVLEAAGIGYEFSTNGKPNIGLSIAGCLIAVLWLVVALSSYRWINRFRHRTVAVADQIERQATGAEGIFVFAEVFWRDRPDAFGDGRAQQRSAWEENEKAARINYFDLFRRPSGLLAGLPILFIIGWILIMIFVHH